MHVSSCMQLEIKKNCVILSAFTLTFDLKVMLFYIICLCPIIAQNLILARHQCLLPEKAGN